MGKMSRDKGARSERQLRDELIRHGWTDVVRVPLSGAVKSRNAYQDDVVGVAPDGKEYRFENKARATGFDPIYKILPRETSLQAVFLESGEMLTLAVDPNVAISDVRYLSISEFDKEHQRVFRSVAKKCRDWIGNAEILSLKQDRKPFIFIRFRR
jgi:hypothetical protein